MVWGWRRVRVGWRVDRVVLGGVDHDVVRVEVPMQHCPLVHVRHLAGDTGLERVRRRWRGRAARSFEIGLR